MYMYFFGFIDPLKLVPCGKQTNKQLVTPALNYNFP